MKIKDIIKKVDKAPEFKSGVLICEFANLLNINSNYYDEHERFVSYWIANWYCTDTWVGTKVYYLDDKPVAISTQQARKDDENLSWISQKAFEKVRNFIEQLQKDEEDQYTKVTILNINEEYSPTYKINYISQLFPYHRKIALYKGKNVEIVETSNKSGFNEKMQYEPSMVKIKFPDSKTKWLELKQLDFPMNLRN